MSLGLLWALPGRAHTDLQLQIDELSRQLAMDPGNTALLLRRGNLHRAHQDWQMARADYRSVREIDPDNDDVDWLAGRMEVEAGQVQTGIGLLSRFLAGNPDHPVALQNRAQAYSLDKQPLMAAKDYEMVIEVSAKPGPSVFGAGIGAYARAGSGHLPQAMGLARRGLERFPGEVTLTGLGTDIALAMTDTGTARVLIDSLPVAVRELPQWQERGALLDCLAGRGAKAAERFEGAAGHSAHGRDTTARLSGEWLRRLAQEPTPDHCRAAALEKLQAD